MQLPFPTSIQGSEATEFGNKTGTDGSDPGALWTRWTDREIEHTKDAADAVTIMALGRGSRITANSMGPER
jgi:hypothetical protein